MKKILFSILTMLYMLTSTGIAMDVHFCMGKESGVDFFNPGTSCRHCGMKEKKGCCHSEHQFHKMEDAHKIVIASENLPPDSDLEAGYTTPTLNRNTPLLSPIFPNPVPPSGTLPLYILISVFRL